MRKKITHMLQEFHDNKQVVIDLGAHRGKKGQIIKHWHIPKLELMQSVTSSISDVGSLLQWLADTTEHAHIHLIKKPAESSNNKDYHPQICHYLDRHEKCRLFDDATTLMLAEDHGMSPIMKNEDLEDPDDNEFMQSETSHPVAILADLWGLNRQVTNFFEKAKSKARAHTSKTWPLHLFVQCFTAIHLNCDPSSHPISIDEATERFSLPDLRVLLTEYFI